MITTVSEMRPPKWFAVASWLALLWMLAGAAAFVMDLMTDEAALAQMSPAQRELYEARPAWIFAMYAVAILSGLVGALALLLRKAWAVHALTLSLVAVVIQFGYVLLAMPVLERVGAAEALTVPILVFVAGTLVLWLAVKAKGSRWIA